MPPVMSKPESKTASSRSPDYGRPRTGSIKDFYPPSSSKGSNSSSSKSSYKESSSDGSRFSEEIFLPKEIPIGPIADAIVKFEGYTHIKGQEYLYIIPDGGPVQFIRGDRPQEFFGTEVCLVRNHRFEGFYFLRTNGIVQSSILDIITANIIRECTIEIRNRVYIETQQFLNERVVGINCGMFVEYIGFPYSISFSMKGLEIYNKAMLVFSSPSTMDIARTSFDNPAHLDCLAAELVLEESSSLYSSEAESEKKLTIEPPSTPKKNKTLRFKGPKSLEEFAEDEKKPEFKPDFKVAEKDEPVKCDDSAQALVRYEPPARRQLNAMKASDKFRASSEALMDDENVASQALVRAAELIRGDCVIQSPRHSNKKTNTLYKTEMCRNWDESGECRYGRSCQFAHGSSELRTVKRHGQWKTKTCLAWVNGGCTYGSRCCYAHEIMDTVQEDLEAGKLSLPYSLDNGPRTPRRNRMAAPAKNEERGPILPPSGISRFAGFFGEQGKRN